MKRVAVYFFVQFLFIASSACPMRAALQRAKPVAKQSATLGSFYSGIEYVDSRYHSFTKPVPEERQQEVRDKLQQLHEQKLFNCDPSRISMFEGGWATRGSLFKQLRVPARSKASDEFNLLHEARHINEYHHLKSIAPILLAILLPSINLRALAASIVAYREVSRLCEEDADIFAAKSCSLEVLANQIRLFDAFETRELGGLAEKYHLSPTTTRLLLAAKDEHYPWRGRMSDRLKEVYASRVGLGIN